PRCRRLPHRTETRGPTLRRLRHGAQDSGRDRNADPRSPHMPPARASSFWGRLRARENAPSTGERDPQPIRPMRQLVFDLVERLLEQEEIEKPVGVSERPWPEPAISPRFPLSAHKCGDRVLAPSVEGGGKPVF